MSGDPASKFDARLDIVPTDPGVYLMKDASDSVIYVGKAKNLRNRLRSYFGKNPQGNAKVLAMISHVADFEYVVVGSELEALLLECNLIKRYQPHYNILLRDDKGFPYVCITMQEEYPRIMKVFRPDKNMTGAKYYGPFLGGDLYRALQALRDIFPTKTCRKVLPRDIGKERACLNYHIGRCVGPCRGDVPAEEYRKVMENMCRFFEGKYDGILRDLEAQMQEASENLDFEKAAVYRDRLNALRAVMANQNVSFPRESDRDAVGFFRDAGEMCFRKLELREGRIIGSSTYFLKDEGETEDSLLEAFLMQYYPTAAEIPKEVLVSIDLENHDAVEQAISDMAGHKVSVHVPQRGDGARLLEMANANAKEALRRRILRVGTSQQSVETALGLLRDKLALRDIPQRIESYDISNLGNDDRCGGMVVFTDGRPDKQAYRLFKIKTVEGQDDYASMREVLLRRFSHAGDEKFAKMPDLILADGGLGQVHAIYSVLEELGLQDKVQLAGMVKDRRHRTHGLVKLDGETIDLAEDAREDEDMMVLFRLITGIQNEVHRFAITYQRKLSKKRNLTYSLETIPGIGTAKRKALMKHFGSIKAISKASKEELMEAERISEKDADAIIAHFRNV
ncbi:MAG: excinuclease ABC subunit UvrC [Saccharofermentanaceae bacterium]|nr:excinuclease ABC subunit UvrC [Saccharofermentanaceae bacterium]HAU50154.1 excinuclease ABC subunit C [Clostridiales bacterium]